MDEKIQTSFIPKTPLDSSSRGKRSGASLFMVGSVFIFVVSIALAGAVFGGQKYLSDQLAKDKQAFSDAQERFDPVSVDYLVSLSKKIELAKGIVRRHSVILPIFEYLQSSTYRTIRFKSMDLSLSENNASTTIEVNMKGEAKNFNDVALQSDKFADNKDFINPIVSDVDMTSTGDVSFNFKTQINPSLLLYGNTRNISE